MCGTPVLVLHAKFSSRWYVGAPAGQSLQPRFKPSAEAVQAIKARNDAVSRIFFIVASRKNEPERRTKPSWCLEDTTLSESSPPSSNAPRGRCPGASRREPVHDTRGGRPRKVQTDPGGTQPPPNIGAGSPSRPPRHRARTRA